MTRQLTSWATSWAAALRIARRELLRNKARNALIVAMLMLPVLAVAALETVWTSASDLTTQERLTRTAGGMDAWIVRTGTQALVQGTSLPVESLPANWAQQVASGDFNSAQASSTQRADASGIRAVLPNATLLAEMTSRDVFMQGPAGYATPVYTKVDLTEPALAGAFDLLSGRVPANAAEVDLSPRAMRDLGARIGGRITLPASSAQDGKDAALAVVGEMYQPDSTHASEVFALPSAPEVIGESPVGWYVLNRGGVSWSQVEAMNKSGYVVTSRNVALDPPPASHVPYNALRGIQPASAVRISAAEAAVLAIGIGIALLEVVLLAGPAFAVSARRREREYAIIGAAGADAGHLRRIVLADGLLLGAVAGVLGAVLGFGAGAAVLPWFADLGILPGHVHVAVSQVAGIAVLSMLLGLCAAWVPARSAARRDILATLNGQRAASSSRIRTARLVKGLILVAFGLCGILLDGKLSPTFGAVFVIGGIALIEIGGIMCIPAVITAVAGCGRILPLGPRLALRDSARNTARTTPAVAAMFAAVAGAVAVGGWLDSSLIQGRDSYQPALMADQVGVPSVNDDAQAAQIVAKLRSIMPITGSAVVQQINAFGGDDTNQWELTALPATGQSRCTAGSVTRTGTPDNSTQLQGCGTPLFGTEMAMDPVGDPTVLKELTGIDDANAVRALDSGGVVVFVPGVVHDGSVTLVLQHAYADKTTSDGTTTTTTDVRVPAVYENPQGIPNPGIVMSPQLAHRMGVADGGTPSLLIDVSRHITASQNYAAQQILTRLGVTSGLTVEDGYTSGLALANLALLAVAVLLAIAAAAIATGLALADGRADHEILKAVGADPWTRRWLAGSTALVITGLGILVGVPIGFLVSEGLIQVSNLGYGTAVAKAFTVPWLNLGALMIAVPLLTALGEIVLTRPNMPRIQRIGT
jgi:putative ABC transport system permease protein